MKRLLTAVILAALIGGAALAQTTVPIPVDTSKATLTIPVNTTFTDAAGVVWELTGTLTARPKPQTTSELPPLPGALGPQVTGFLDHHGARIGGDAEGNPAGYGVIGQPAAILGSAFGSVPGTVLWGGMLPCEVLAWEDAVIRFRVPPGVDPVFGYWNPETKREEGATTRRNTVGVRTAAGQWATSLGFARRAE